MKSLQIFPGAALLLCLSFACLAASAAPLPSKITLHYDVQMGGISLAEGIETLEQDGKTYQIHSEARGKGIVAALYKGAIKRTVKGAITRDGLHPQEYEDQRGDRQPTRAVFDWPNKVVALTNDGKTDNHVLPANANDRLSYLYQYAFAPLPKGDIDVTAVDGKGMTHFHFFAGVKEKLATPLGELDTVKLVKQRDSPDDKETEVWLAPSLHYLPVRILIVETNGNRADQMISRIEQ